jgi:periplasmic protein CpxP/Spy
MSKKLIPIAVIAVLAITGALVFGCGPHRFFCAPPEKKAEYIVKKLTRDLDLTKDQVVKVNKIKEEILERTKVLRNDRDAVHRDVVAMVKSDKLERNTVNNFISKREDKILALKPFIVDKLVEFHDILTPQQRIKLAEKMEKFHKWCHR